MRIESSSVQFASLLHTFSRYERNEQLKISLPNRVTGQVAELIYSNQQSKEASAIMSYAELRRQAATLCWC